MFTENYNKIHTSYVINFQNYFKFLKFNLYYLIFDLASQVGSIF